VKKIYLHTSQIPGFIKAMAERNPSVVADHPEHLLLYRELKVPKSDSPHWERWRPLTEALMTAEEETWADGVHPTAWLCPSCYEYNVDSMGITAIPFCGGCDQPVEWDELWSIVFDPEEATE
jgi:hypothetical protein